MRRRGKPLLICFIGIDGSGKTTHAQGLALWLEGQGVRNRYVWNIFEPRLLELFIKLGHGLFLRRKSLFEDYDEYCKARKGLFRFPGAARLFHYLFFVEYLLRFLPKVRIPLLLGRSVVCDRYVYDAVVGLAADLNYSYPKIASTIGKLLQVMPRPDLIFLIDVPEEIAFQRKNDIPSVAYLVERRRIYLQLARDHSMVLLDGSRDVGEIQGVVRGVVAKYLGKTTAASDRAITRLGRGV